MVSPKKIRKVRICRDLDDIIDSLCDSRRNPPQQRVLRFVLVTAQILATSVNRMISRVSVHCVSPVQNGFKMTNDNKVPVENFWAFWRVSRVFRDF